MTTHPTVRLRIAGDTFLAAPIETNGKPIESSLSVGMVANTTVANALRRAGFVFGLPTHCDPCGKTIDLTTGECGCDAA